MRATDHARRTALSGIAGALLGALAAGPALADLGMQQHPLRGDFPTAAGGSASAATAAGADQVAIVGHWLRGDFPEASGTKPEPVAAVASAIGDTWKCSLDQASMPPTKFGPSETVMRVIKLVQ